MSIESSSERQSLTAAASASASAGDAEPPGKQQQVDTNESSAAEAEVLISQEVASLQDLALRGSWRTIIDKVSRARSLSLLSYPHEHLVFLTFNAIALTKLRRFSEALNDIETSIDNLDNPSLRYESYPHLYPNRRGSMVPFSLRWLHALLPFFLRSADSLDRLYLLLHFVRSQIGDVWRRREKLVMGTLVSLHSSQKEFGVCLSLIRDMLSRDVMEPSLLSKLGYVQLQFGDLEGAKSSFDRAEKVITEKSLSSVENQNLVGRNKALIYMVAKDYVSAVREYDECIERDASDVVAINNKALCLMYLRDLSDSIKVLENSLERVPTVAINETLVVNLCSMYELAFVNHSDLKKTLSNWIARVAPDDFDPSCTRI